MYDGIFNGMLNRQADDEIVKELRSETDLSAIREITDDDRKHRKNFSVETKNAIYLREALMTQPKCAICGARMHSKSITIDHVERRQDGGDGSAANGRLTHPYCNSGYKESVYARGKRHESEPR
jgi:hypothetical protein